MKNTLILFFVTFLGIQSFSQTFDIDTIKYSGDVNKRINIVLLADGYQTAELDQFIIDVNNFISGLFLEQPYKEYENYFNVFAIKVPSNESGASHPGTATDVVEANQNHPVISVDNYFGSTFDYAGIHRLLVATNTSSIYTVLGNNFPLYDVVVVMANSSYYGGSGGFIATVSTNVSSAEVAEHELGHTFAQLGDEYYAGDNYATEKVNMTQNTDPSSVKWKNWYGDNGIGIYQHSGSGNASQWYKPHQNCKMQYLNNPFCSVCIEATIEKIHAYINPIDSYSPSSLTIQTTSFPIEFSLELINPSPNTLKIDWTLNNNLIYSNLDTIQLLKTDLIEGTNQLQVVVEDTTNLIRIDNHISSHLTILTWSIAHSTAAIEEISSTKIDLDIYPNPTQDQLTINLLTDKNQNYTVEMISIEGKKVLEKTFKNEDVDHTLNVQSISPGKYLLKFTLENGITFNKTIIKN